MVEKNLNNLIREAELLGQAKELLKAGVPTLKKKKNRRRNQKVCR